MIRHLAGTLMHKDLQGAIIACSGVGYGVQMPVDALLAIGEVGQDAQVFVSTQMSQDALKLYGFVSYEALLTFEILLATAGVGPRLALAILSALTPQTLGQAVLDGERAVLTQIPGVGLKKAERLLLELKGRLPIAPSVAQAAVAQSGPSAKTSANNTLSDVVAALVHLGFAAPAAEAAAHHARRAMPEAIDNNDVAQLMREALRSTMSLRD